MVLEQNNERIAEGERLLAEGAQLVIGLRSERDDAIKMLRQVCERHGDNDWRDDLNLADVIQKHLMRHLEAAADKSGEDYPG